MADAVAFMSRHFVALTCEYEIYQKDGTVKDRGTLVYSGFLLELHGFQFWVTAGHCIKDELHAGLSSGQMRIVGGSFMDCFGFEANHKQSIPYTYELGDSYFVEQPELGLDFALIPLNDLLAKGFAANNLIPITRKNWVHQPNLTFEFYRMLGIPKDRVIKQVGKNGVMQTYVGQAMVALDAISPDDLGEPPDDVKGSPSPAWFTGRLDPGCKIESLKGMSGGPIYGFRRDKDGNLLYHVVALQSRWWPKPRTVFGCSMTVFAEEVYRQLGEFFATLSEDIKGTANLDDV